MRLDIKNILEDIGLSDMNSHDFNHYMLAKPFPECDLLDILPDYVSDNPNLVFEANLQYSAPDSYAALYKNSKEVRENLIYPIVVSRGKTTAAHFTKRNGWMCYQLIYTHSGSGMIYLDNRMYELKPATMFLLDCRPYHYFFSNDAEGWEYSLIHFDGGNSKYLCGLVESNSLLYNNMAASRAIQKFNRIFELSRNDSSAFEMVFHELMTELLISLCSEKTGAANPIDVPSWLSSVQSHIAEYYNQDIRVEELAKMAYLSPSRFAHRFKELVGVSPIEYQYTIRISYAKDYLDTTNMPLDEICEKVGFHNEANFYARFKQSVGVPPGKYRKRGEK